MTNVKQFQKDCYGMIVTPQTMELLSTTLYIYFMEN
jgi:hypothetical protein